MNQIMGGYWAKALIIVFKDASCAWVREPLETRNLLAATFSSKLCLQVLVTIAFSFDFVKSTTDESVVFALPYVAYTLSQMDIDNGTAPDYWRLGF